MITVYTNESSFKKKLTVVAIWLVAFTFAFMLIDMIMHHESSLLLKAVPIVVGLFMIAGILLRCKIARGITLVVLYALAFFPLMVNALTGSSFIMLSAEGNELFTTMEILITNVIWALLFVVPVYFLSNNKSMEIFFIQQNPLEHIFFALGGILVAFGYIHFLM